MKELCWEPSSSLLAPPHFVAKVPLPPPPPSRPSALLSSSPTLQLLPHTNGTGASPVGTLLLPPPPPHSPSVVPTAVRPFLPWSLAPPSPTSASLPHPPLSMTSPGGTTMAWLHSGGATSAALALPPVSTPPIAPVSWYIYSQPPTSFTSSPTVPPSPAQPAVSAPSASYFPVPFHLQQHPQAYQQIQQYQQQLYQQGPVPYTAQPHLQSQHQVTQPAVVQAAAQSTYQYQAVYQPAAPAALHAVATPTPEIFAMPQQQQAQQLFQRDAQTITPEALESVKAALASGEGEHKSEARKRAVPRRAAGHSWEDQTLADWPENDHRLFCGDLGNEVNDEVLTKAFTRFATFNLARVVRDKRTGKTKGYGFVSFGDPCDLALAFKEMNGKYVGNRPIKLRKSTWKERTDQEAFHKHAVPSWSPKSIFHRMSRAVKYPQVDRLLQGFRLVQERQAIISANLKGLALLPDGLAAANDV